MNLDPCGTYLPEGGNLREDARVGALWDALDAYKDGGENIPNGRAEER